MSLGTQVIEYARGALRQPRQYLRSHPARECPICGFRGRFVDVGPRPEARCPNCSSKERDRITALFLKREEIELSDKAVLHFSPERSFYRRWKNYPRYVAGDVKKSPVANAIVDITDIQFTDGHFDFIICHHILEHVPADAKGMVECFRVLKPGGTALFSVPIDLERETTWEPPVGMSVEEIERICGRHHVRLYGRDFEDKLRAAGFSVDVIRYTPEEGERYRLREVHDGPMQNLDRLYVCRKTG